MLGIGIFAAWGLVHVALIASIVFALTYVFKTVTHLKPGVRRWLDAPLLIPFGHVLITKHLSEEGLKYRKRLNVALTALFLTLLAGDGLYAVTDRLTDRRGGQASAASLRVVVVVRIGDPFGGFRIAFRPGFIDWPEGFAALEKTVERMVAFLVNLPPDQRLRLLRGETPWPREFAPQEFAPRFGDRHGGIDFIGGQNTDGAADLVLRGSFPFPWWPLGEWVVFEGVHFKPDNHTEPFSYDELKPWW